MSYVAWDLLHLERFATELIAALKSLAMHSTAHHFSRPVRLQEFPLNRITAFSLLPLSFILSACGGGSDEQTPVTADASNNM